MALEAVLSRNGSRTSCKRAHGSGVTRSTYSMTLLSPQAGPTWPTTARALARKCDKARRRSVNEWLWRKWALSGALDRGCDDVGVFGVARSLGAYHGAGNVPKPSVAIRIHLQTLFSFFRKLRRDAAPNICGPCDLFVAPSDPHSIWLAPSPRLWRLCFQGGSGEENSTLHMHALFS